jgi:integrase
MEQAQIVLETAGEDARWWLGLFCGMRQGEVLGLRWQDVDLQTGVLTIAQTLQTEDGQLTFGTPKSDAGARSWPMPPWVEARVRLHWIAQGQPTEGLVFAREDGTPIRPWADYKAWQALLDQAGQPRVALHSARQSSASLMEAAGVADRLAAQILGHSTVQITHGYQSADHERIRAAWISMGQVYELTPPGAAPH